MGFGFRVFALGCRFSGFRVGFGFWVQGGAKLFGILPSAFSAERFFA